jgi:hypothetical protein
MRGSLVVLSAADRLTTLLQSWVANPDNDAEWTGVHEGRIGLRVAQRARDYTTIWFDVGQRTVGVEAFLLPAPPHNRAAVHEYCLNRNRISWPAYIARNQQGDLFVMARHPVDTLDVETIEGLVGAVYETIELAFPTLLQIGFIGREKTS